jgi:FAD/FMN-containing dehydrogenase
MNHQQDTGVKEVNPKQPPAPPSSRVNPDDQRYPSLVRGFNQRWVGQPHYIEVCNTEQEVVQAVQQALNENRRITVRSGGHCYENFVCDNPEGVLIDLSQMKEVYFDQSTNCYCIEAGATLWDVYNYLFKEYGVTLPGGSCYSVGAGGHITGGGYGLLSRKYGLTIDYLYAVEVVVVDASKKAQAITVSRDSTNLAERDLFWGHLGGGGGNFGIVTKFYFRHLPPAPQEVYLMNLAWDWSEFINQPNMFKQLVNAYGQFLEANSGVDSPYAGLFTLLHLTANGPNQQIVLTAQYAGDEPERLEYFQKTITDSLLPLPPTRQKTPVGYYHFLAQDTTIQKLPWLVATQTLNGSGIPRRGKYKSAYMRKTFPQSQIDAMWQILSNTPSKIANSQALLQIDSYGCQINAVEPTATAIPQRSSVMKLQYQIYWADEADDHTNLAWIRHFYTTMYGEKGPVPDGTLMDGCYINYPDVDLVDWQNLYYKENYPRLVAVKNHWDPLNIFHHQQSIT